MVRLGVLLLAAAAAASAQAQSQPSFTDFFKMAVSYWLSKRSRVVEIVVKILLAIVFFPIVARGSIDLTCLRDIITDR